MSINWYQGVVVGVDGSHESLAALDWATHTADLHDARLTVVAAYAVPILLSVARARPRGRLVVPGRED
ncbi:universal stress protein [Promicromonospora sp. Populi]|uniref:universal stress protein n=1 Tax=Promicromonospora sp. Populi TaxID=3239420 RepID=UPI0034E2E159